MENSILVHIQTKRIFFWKIDSCSHTPKTRKLENLSLVHIQTKRKKLENSSLVHTQMQTTVSLCPRGRRDGKMDANLRYEKPNVDFAFSMLFYVSVRTVRDEEPRATTSTFTQLLNSEVQCCFTSTETVRTIRDGEPRTATSTFAQLLGSE